MHMCGLRLKSLSLITVTGLGKDIYVSCMTILFSMIILSPLRMGEERQEDLTISVRLLDQNISIHPIIILIHKQVACLVHLQHVSRRQTWFFRQPLEKGQGRDINP